MTAHIDYAAQQPRDGAKAATATPGTNPPQTSVVS
jgi:hypothetical protein